ncbi:F-box/kelch-repeat protein At1g80440-like [Curcuma longa]|uniref:F-box/kelch-repeat protein At1g80440-like n=1 Tax=Curcuma longa TaxID=136217 RepID=UPI003D9F3358
MAAELIPGLPECLLRLPYRAFADDIALECLLRLPYRAFADARRVCKRWRQEITSPSFCSLRKASGHARLLVQFEFYRDPLIIFGPTMGVWTRMPAVFDWSAHYRQVAAVGHELVMLGRDATVDVYNLLTGVRRRGATMPGPRRTNFAFAVAAEARMVYVAGGENVRSWEPLQSALAYDVAADAWVWLPDMARPRAVCRGIFVNGAFCVAGGQWLHDCTSETFNVAEGRWTAKQVKLLEETLIDPSTKVATVEGRVYTWREVDACSNIGGVRGWRRLGVPANLFALYQAPLAAWKGRVAMLAITLQARPTAFSLEEGEWRRVVMPTELTGYVELRSFQL